MERFSSGGRRRCRLLLGRKGQAAGLRGSVCVGLRGKRKFHEGNWSESWIQVTVSWISAVVGQIVGVWLQKLWEVLLVVVEVHSFGLIYCSLSKYYNRLNLNKGISFLAALHFAPFPAQTHPLLLSQRLLVSPLLSALVCVDSPLLFSETTGLHFTGRYFCKQIMRARRERLSSSKLTVITSFGKKNRKWDLSMDLAKNVRFISDGQCHLKHLYETLLVISRLFSANTATVSQPKPKNQNR